MRSTRIIVTCSLALGAASARGEPPPEVLVIAHRGNSLFAPENTLIAIEQALADGAHLVEVDVRLTRDGIPVLVHDATVDRTSDGRGRVSRLRLAELAGLDAGAWKSPRYRGERIATLAQALALARSRGRRLLLDPKVDGLAPAVSEVFRAQGVPFTEALVGAWTSRQVEEFHDHLPGSRILRTGEVPRRWSDDWFERERRRGIVGFEVDASLPPEFIAAAHGHGLPVYVYTLNGAPEIEAMIRAGADGIETDFPRGMVRIVERLARVGFGFDRQLERGTAATGR